MRPIARLTPLLLVPLAAAIASTLAPSAARGDDLPPTVIATLDRAPIPVERFAAALRETGVSLAALDPEDRDRLKREMLQEIIEQEILLREARDRGCERLCPGLESPQVAGAEDNAAFDSREPET